MLAHPCPVAGTPATKAARWGVTLSGNVVVREAVEAETHKLLRNRAVAFGCHHPWAALVTTAHDGQETLGVDVGPLMWMPIRVRH
jgi:hypothetical protein